MNLISIFSYGEPGGALTNVSFYLACGLALNDQKVELVFIGNTSSQRLIEFYKDIEGINNISVFHLGVRHSRNAVYPLVKYLREKKPDVIISQLALCNITALVSKKLARVTSKNIFLEGTMISKVGSIGWKKMPKLKLIPLLVKWFYPKADGIIVKNKDILEDFLSNLNLKIDPKKTAVLPNPYAFDRFLLLSDEPVDHNWFNDSQIPIIITAGRLHFEKGYDILINAFAEVRKKLYCRLVILGDGPEREKLVTQAKMLNVWDDMYLPGRVDNPWKYFKRSNVFVLTSRWEGWPSALMEAMACGLPVISGDCPGGAKDMIKNEESGLIINTDNLRNLIDATVLILENEKFSLALGNEATKQVQKFDYKIIAIQYMNYLNSII